MILYNVKLKAFNSRVQENLKNSMTIDMHRKFFIYNIISVMLYLANIFRQIFL